MCTWWEICMLELLGDEIVKLYNFEQTFTLKFSNNTIWKTKFTELQKCRTSCHKAVQKQFQKKMRGGAFETYTKRCSFSHSGENPLMFGRLKKLSQLGKRNIWACGIVY